MALIIEAPNVFGPEPHEFVALEIVSDFDGPIHKEAGRNAASREIVGILDPLLFRVQGQTEGCFTTLVVRMTLLVTFETLPPVKARPSQTFAFDRDQTRRTGLKPWVFSHASRSGASRTGTRERSRSGLFIEWQDDE